MAGETIQFEKAAEQSADESAKRQQSTILFPYLDLDAAIEVAQAMYRTRGHSAMEAHELAATMSQTVSGAFRLKTGTARIFGLSEKEGRDAAKLSALGIAIIEPETERAARAEAFMNVPLYRAIYEKYKGQRLPPRKALEREMEALGVSGKQTDKARQAFERSARQAGYFEHGEDRLVRPRVDEQVTADRQQSSEEEPKRNEKRGGGVGSGSGGGKDHPLIQGLLVTLPEPGKAWDIAGRKAWLTMAASIFDMIYTKPADAAGNAMDTFDKLFPNEDTGTDQE